MEQIQSNGTPTISVWATRRKAVELIAKFRFEIPHLSERPFS
jgi:hypothetical protein